MYNNLGTWAFTHGLHDLGNGLYAWLQPDGGWGWSNAGLICDDDQSLVVDTLFDLKLTHEMLAAITDKRAVGAMMEYLRYISHEARLRFDAGMEQFEAARDINLSDFDSWGDSERIAVNVASLYREFAGKPPVQAPGEVYRQMAILRRERR